MDACLKSEEVEAFVAGEVSAEKKERVDTHLASCANCRNVVEAYRHDRTLAQDIHQAYGIDLPDSMTAFGSAPGEVPTLSESIEGYEILQEIHRGGQGVVYKAVQLATKRTVALKVLLHGTYASPRQRHRFEREIDLVASLQHPNIVTIYDSGSTNGRPYFAMEYIRGQSLDNYLSAAKLSIDATLLLFQKICSAVNAAHQRGVIHRDLKPGNIRIDADGEPHILDFGLAKTAGSDLQGGVPVTMSGEFMGTLAYASPEQTKGDPNLIDVRSDVYSLGVILFEMLTGMYPYEVSGHLTDILRNIAEAEPKRPSTIRRQVNDEVETIVLQALAKERERRYQSAEALARDVGRYLVGEPLDAKRASTWYVIRKSLRRYRVAAGVAIAFALLLTAATIALSIMYQSQRRARDEADRARALADQRYEEVIRLADLKRLADAVAAADDLWPAHPENIAAMETWLETQAFPLRDNLPKHVATLEALRDQALEYDSAQLRRDRETHPKAAELSKQRRHLARLQRDLDNISAVESEDAEEKAQKTEELNEAIAETAQSISELQQAVQERYTWRFDEKEAQWQHDTLAALVVDLKRFLALDPMKGTLRSVEERLRFARRIEERSFTGADAAAKWAEAIADIAQLEIYGGLQLTPQLGLVPLRRDPRSGLWEFWHIQSGSRPEPNPDVDAVNPWILTGDTGLVFVLVPGGTFWMGAQRRNPEGHNYDPYAVFNERPVHPVTLDPFFISKYEMTQGQWQQFTGRNPSRYDPSWAWKGDPPRKTVLQQNHLWNPVEQVNWADCRDVLRRLGLVLPTEAQWEYTARAGTDSPWWTGHDKESIGVRNAGNLADGWSKSVWASCPWGGSVEEWLEDGFVTHAPVGSYQPNGFGLHDTIGNLWEWCRDGFWGYDSDPGPGDGLRTGTFPLVHRMARGGSYYNAAINSRCAYRYNATPEDGMQSFGVRPARAVVD